MYILHDTGTEVSTSCKYVKIIQISCGCYHSVFLSEKHEVFTCGRGSHGQLGHGNIFEWRIPKQVAGLKHRNAVKIAAGFYHTVVLVSNSLQLYSSSLSNSFVKLLNSPTRSDVVFLVEKKEIFAHRCIIFARCSKLDEFINNEGEKSKTSGTIVNIHGVSHEGFLKFLHFLYTDQLDIWSDKTLTTHQYTKQLMELMSLGDKFQMEKLRSLAEHYAKKSLTAESVAITLKISYDIDDQMLKAHCIEYIMKHFGEVIGTTAFSELPPLILKEVLGTASKKGAIIQND